MFTVETELTFISKYDTIEYQPAEFFSGHHYVVLLC